MILDPFERMLTIKCTFGIRARVESSTAITAARTSMAGIAEADVREALNRLDPLWDELFPAEQARVVQLLVERVNVGLDGADIRLRTCRRYGQIG